MYFYSPAIISPYIDAGPPTGKYILQQCIGLNIPEPLGPLLAGESVEELELDWI